MLTKYKIVSMNVNKQTEIQKVLEIAKKSNGTFTTRMVDEAGISRGILKYMCDKGQLDKECRGVYSMPDLMWDDFLKYQARFRKGIYSHETALFFWDLSDRTPDRYVMTFPKGYNLTNVKKEHLRPVVMKEKFYNMGIVEATTLCGNKVKAYCIEKCLCDMLSPYYAEDIEVLVHAYKWYVRKRGIDLNLLSEYAEIMGVEKIVRYYMEVLL